MLEEAVSTLYRDVQGPEQHLSAFQGLAWTLSGSLAEGGSAYFFLSAAQALQSFLEAKASADSAENERLIRQTSPSC
eukprot:s1975_g16.t1